MTSWISCWKCIWDSIFSPNLWHYYTCTLHSTQKNFNNNGKQKLRIPKVDNVHSNPAQKLKALSGVGVFFPFNKTFNSCFDVNFFFEGSRGVGLNLILQISKPYGFSFGSFSSSTTYRLNLKIESNFTDTLHIFQDWRLY